MNKYLQDFAQTPAAKLMAQRVVDRIERSEFHPRIISGEVVSSFPVGDREWPQWVLYGPDATIESLVPGTDVYRHETVKELGRATEFLKLGSTAVAVGYDRGRLSGSPLLVSLSTHSQWVLTEVEDEEAAV